MDVERFILTLNEMLRKWKKTEKLCSFRPCALSQDKIDWVLRRCATIMLLRYSGGLVYQLHTWNWVLHPQGWLLKREVRCNTGAVPPL